MSGTAAGWYSDPTARYSYRYWSGTAWTEQVSNGSTTAIDPTALAPDVVSMAPAPGTEAAQPAAAPTVQVSQSGGGGGGVGTLIGVLIGLVIVVVIVAAIVLNSGDDSSSTTDAPVTTEAPATTSAP